MFARSPGKRLAERQRVVVPFVERSERERSFAVELPVAVRCGRLGSC